MAPIRRYLRITKYSVLECRIYLDNPALAQSWLLNPRDPVLPRVIESVRPLVLPKLREEKERNRKKSSKKKGIKDVVQTDEFEVSIFLTETSTRHSLLAKHKIFREKLPPRLKSNSTRLVGATNDTPIDIDSLDDTTVPGLLHEESDDDAVVLADIPTVADTGHGKRHRGSNSAEESSSEGGDDNFELGPPPPPKRPRRRTEVQEEGGDDKKKLAMDVSYEGFAIYGLVLCLVVKRRGAPGRAGQPSRGDMAGSQAIMEKWISSTQLPAGVEEPS